MAVQSSLEPSEPAPLLPAKREEGTGLAVVQSDLRGRHVLHPEVKSTLTCVSQRKCNHPERAPYHSYHAGHQVLSS